MPGHDHSLQKLYSIDELSNPSMVYNWICPIQLKEDCPYEVMACVFNEYFTDTNWINTNQEYLNFGWATPLFNRVGLVLAETSCQKDALVSEKLFIIFFFSIKTTWYSNLNASERCELFLCFLYLYSLRILAIFNHFGYSSLQLDQWQQHTWYDLGATQDLLHCMCNQLVRGLPAAASPPRVEPPSPFYMQTSMPTHPAHLGNFVKASKGGGSPQNAATARPSSTTMVTPPKTEVKKRKKKKWTTPKCTVTSETVPAPEKKRKVISESPDSEAEGPFRDSDHTESASENSPNTNQ